MVYLRRIEATIYNARAMWNPIRQYGSFHAYLCSLDGLDHAARHRELSRRFHNLGPTGAFVFGAWTKRYRSGKSA